MLYLCIEYHRLICIMWTVLYLCIEYHIQVNMYHVSTQGVDERVINVHYYYCEVFCFGLLLFYLCVCVCVCVCVYVRVFCWLGGFSQMLNDSTVFKDVDQFRTDLEENLSPSLSPSSLPPPSLSSLTHTHTHTCTQART